MDPGRLTGVTGLKKEKKKEKKNNNFIYAFILIFFIVSLSIPMYKGIRKKIELEKEISVLSGQSAEAARYNNDLKNRIKYSDEDEYVEKVAREKLNMVKPDEILFIDAGK